MFSLFAGCMLPTLWVQQSVRKVRMAYRVAQKYGLHSAKYIALSYCNTRLSVNKLLFLWYKKPTVLPWFCVIRHFVCRVMVICLYFMPNTHRRRRRVASASTVCIEFATSSRRLPTTADENLETEHVGNLSCRVELCRRCVHTRRLCRDPVYNSTAYMWLAQKIGNWVTTDDWCVTPPTRRNSTSLSANCSDSSRLVETVAN